jgi:hypothetical protein
MGGPLKGKHEFTPDKCVETYNCEAKRVKHVPAIILYPALVTPAVLTKNDALEILLLGKNGQDITEKNVSEQLKIVKGLDPNKCYTESALPRNLISNTGKGTLNDGIIKTAKKDKKSTFNGMLDKRALDLFRKYGYTKYYCFQIANNNLFNVDSGGNRNLYNLIWFCDPQHMEGWKSDDGDKWKEASTGDKKPLHLYTPQKMSEPQVNLIAKIGSGKTKVFPNELHDRLIIEGVLDRINGDRIREGGKYCFKEGIPPSGTKLNDPLQSYHPVFYFSNLEYANIAHVSDVHLCARQHLMTKSEARVIEYGENRNGKYEELDLNVSPKIGNMVNINLENFKYLLSEVGSDNSIHVLLVGGDLIDYIKSLYDAKGSSSAKRRISEIWDILELDSKYENNYQDFVDYISLYSVLVSFYRTYKKPVFIVNGNHDAYYCPYGISPRVVFELKKANEGIPADHNLTMYEAILIFGETYPEVKKKTNFVPEKFEWFYSVLTPFSDFAVYLPKQVLAGFAWGEKEDVIGVVNDTGQGFWGHLPRSDKAISDNQKSFFEDILNNKGERKVILASHFTFVSYADGIPMYPMHEGDIEYDWSWDASQYDMGTFETNRKPFYENHLAGKRDVQCILTGHAHRKGLYIIDRVDKSGENSVKTKFYEFSQFAKTNSSKRYPVIIVSDSAGPIPRFNKTGEFFGWGSDRPSGTKLVFAKDGSISSIQSIQLNCDKCPRRFPGCTRCKPRFVVALDYMDLIADKKVIETFMYTFGRDDEDKLKSYNFNLVLHPDIKKLVYVNKVLLYSYKSGSWKKLDLNFDSDTERWVVQDVKTFREWFTSDKAKVFVAIKFRMKHKMNSILHQYNFDSYWCFPVKIETGFAPAMKHYTIVRDEDLAEIPEFKWIKKAFAKYA